MKKTVLLCGLFVLLMGGCATTGGTESKSDSSSKETSTSSTTVESTTKQKESSASKKKRKSKKSLTPSSTTESSKKKEAKESEDDGQLFLPNPEDDDKEVSYQSSGEGNISAFVPDYSQYNKAQVILKLGEPSQTITDTTEIRERLEGNEWDLIKAQFNLGKLTEEQAKAFMFATTDLSMAAAISMKLELLVYEDQNKPNVYLSESKVQFITPMTEYIDFNGKIDAN